MNATPVPLTAGDAQRLGLWRTSLLGSQALRRHIERYPDLVWRLDEDFALGGLWRHRPEIGEVLETVGRRGRPELLAALVEAYRRRGCQAVVAGAHESFRIAAEYQALGWQEIEQLIFYRHSVTAELPPLDPLSFRIRDATAADLDAVLAIDRFAFAWLWQESRPALAAYVDQPGRLFWVAERAGDTIGYLAANYRARAANIDRLGVHPAAQGGRIGWGLLATALRHFQRRGIVELSLNTQASNERSQRLYMSLGFTPIGDPRPLLGRLDLPAALAGSN